MNQFEWWDRPKANDLEAMAPIRDWNEQIAHKGDLRIALNKLLKLEMITPPKPSIFNF